MLVKLKQQSYSTTDDDKTECMKLKGKVVGQCLEPLES